MKKTLRNLCSPLLRPLESGTGAFEYKPSHRKALLFISVTFLGLATTVLVRADGADAGYLFPVCVFGIGGLLGLVIGLLGEDRAVAKIWGSGNK